MADTSSTTTFRADISALKSEMQAASRVIRVANSEFKAATAGMDDWSKSADGLEAKIKQLDSTLKAQNRQVELAAEELEKTEKEYGKNSAEADRARIKYNNFKAAAAQTEKALNEYEDELKDVATETEDVEEATEKAGDGFTVFKGIVADLASTVIKSAVRGIGNLAKETFKVGADFEKAMSQVEAVSGASAEEIDALSDKAKEMGSTTVFSATEAAEAFNYMAMAGWKTQDMLDGIEGIMNLAAASGADLATTSDIVTDALTAMGYEAKDAGHLADVMAAASSNANTNVEMMGATFQYAAPLVGALGYNMEDTAVAIGMMANAGIKGEKAGTALRSILTRLSTGTGDAADAMNALGISLTKVNEDGSTSMRSLDEVMRDLRVAFADLDETQQTQYASALAGQEAMSGLLAIVNGSDTDFENLTAAVQGCDGAAADMAGTMNDNVDGALTLLKSNIEGKMIGVFEAAAPAIKEAIGKISEALDNINWDNVAKAVGDIAQGFADFVTWCVDHGEEVTGIIKGIAGAVVGIFVVDKASTFITTIGKVTSAIAGIGTQATTSTGLVGSLAALISNPATWVITGIVAVTGAVIALNAGYDEAIAKTYGLSDAEKQTVQHAEELANSYENTDQKRQESFKSIDTEYGYLDELVGEYHTLLDENGNVKQGYEDRAAFITSTLANALGIEQEDVQAVINKNSELEGSIDSLIQKKQAEALVMAGEDAYKEAIQNRDDALTTYQDALALNEKQEKEYADQVASNGDVLDTYANLLRDYPLAAKAYYLANREAIEGTEASYEALQQSRDGLKNAEEAYVGYVSTIENYEGASAAVMSGDADAIALAIAKMENNFVSAKTGTKEILQEQVKDYQQHYTDLKQALEDGMPGVTQAQVDSAKELVKAAVKELKNLPKETETVVDEVVAGFDYHAADVKKAGEKAGESAVSGADTALVGFNASGQTAAENLEKGLASGEADLEAAGKAAAEAVAEGTENAMLGLGGIGTFGANALIDGINDQDNAAKNSGKKIGEEVGKGADSGLVGFSSSGKVAAGNFNSGISSKNDEAKTAGSNLAGKAKSGTDGADTYSSGQNFAQGYINGIGSLISSVANKAAEMVRSAVQAAKAAQKEGSPSKVTYQSGVYFTQGYILGIASEEKNLIKTVQGLVGSAVKELTKLSNYNFDQVGKNASAAFTSAIEKQTNYMITKIQYQNQQKLKALDSELERLQKQKSTEKENLEKASTAKQEAIQAASDKKLNALEKKRDKTKSSKQKKKLNAQIKAEKDAAKKLLNTEKNTLKAQIKNSEENYDALIDAQRKYQDYYSEASSEMLSEFEQAIAEYQNQAQELIDSTIEGITDRYTERYNELISKQDKLVNKLKEASDLFTVSNAGVMMIGNLQEQTKQITDYTDRLKAIKDKVSAELFDKITEYDIKEGMAFLDRLLGMSEAELQAYNEAYTAKMEAAEKAAETIYGSDLKKVADDYQSELETAFAGLPEQLKELGNQAMKGFIDGLKMNTDFMETEVQTFITAMIDEFKKDLQIRSPSKVMFNIGEYTGEGFVDGVASLITQAKDAASNLAASVAQPLSDVSGDIGLVRSAAGQYGSGTAAGVVNNYNLVQNNNSPKALTALETYQARRRQIALVKAFA